MLKTYGGLVFICLAAQGVGAYMAIKYNHDLEQYVNKGIKSTLDAYKWELAEDEATNRAINEFQKQLQCCGGKDRYDWNGVYGKPEAFYKKLVPPILVDREAANTCRASHITIRWISGRKYSTTTPIDVFLLSSKTCHLEGPDLVLWRAGENYAKGIIKELECSDANPKSATFKYLPFLTVFAINILSGLRSR
ncbi:unnamed protein product [Oppiella nova]|uniref:Uncharacterized protein n=1 Tax=Oppiella nova TaxID=334625 RepID=A0A7R9QS66_9ACAR|nr:unnamed protein product [Oppiella nova]CAG2173062.1 unnamed protein product [Oppiella nova]